jgi:hypothetical protein
VRRLSAAPAALFFLAFVLGILRFEGPTEGYWDTYIAAPAMFLTGHPVDFVLKDGSTAWQVHLAGVIPDDLVDADSFGIITKDQRIGAPVVAAPMFWAFGLFGFHLLYALANALLVPTGFLAARSALAHAAVERPALPALAGAAALALNPYVLSVDRLNANLLVLAPCLLLLHLLLRPRVPWVAAGLMFGAIAGIRNEAVCFVPAITLWGAWGRTGDAPLQRLRNLVLFGACCLLAMVPVFAWKDFAFGHPLMHPSQYPHFQGFRPEFAHSLFGWEFSFNGLFNWPLHDTLVRTPHFGFPTWLLFPLVTVRALGTLGAGLLLLGMGRLRSRPALLATLLLWAGGVYLLFGPQENWEEVKMTFMLLAWPVLPILVAAGLASVLERPQRTGVLLLLAALVFGAVKACALLDAPADERWYVRFPNAALATNPGAQRGLAEDERNDWIYFQSYETPDEVARERAKLTAGWPWPARYLPVSWSPGPALSKIAAESGQKQLTVLEIWGYIYGSRR